MDILSLQFLCFSAITFAVIAAIPARHRTFTLLVASITFFLFFSIWNAVILLLITAANFWIARKLDQNTSRGRWLVTGLSLDVAALVFYKLHNQVLIANLCETLLKASGSTSLKAEQLLPIGLSFYTLQGISYLLDIYHRRTTATSHFIDFAVYMSFFPKALAGPIERADRFLPQLRRQHPSITQEQFMHGSYAILLGLVQKVIIANTLHSLIPSSIFQNANQFPASELILYLLFYGIWLYNDFAGYSNMALGISLFFGIELTQNFRQPYLAHNFAEFWNRWHISLSSWLRDYIFMPLARHLLRRNRKPNHPSNLILPPLVTMVISGLWHAVDLSMLCWGVLYAIYLISTQVMKNVALIQNWTRGRRFFSWIGIGTVFILVNLAWVFFASGSLTESLSFFKNLVFPRELSATLSFQNVSYPLCLVGMSFMIDIIHHQKNDNFALIRFPLPLRAILTTLVISWLLFTGFQTQINATPMPTFLYQSF